MNPDPTPIMTFIRKTIFRASIVLNVAFIVSAVILVYAADLKISGHMTATAGNDAQAATEQQADARTALSEIMADKDMNAIKAPARKPAHASK